MCQKGSRKRKLTCGDGGDGEALFGEMERIEDELRKNEKNVVLKKQAP
jgi:hypothetical protein